MILRFHFATGPFGTAALAIAAALSSSARGQCDFGWLSHPIPGFNDELRCMAAFDDGSGPAMYVGGWFTSVCGMPASGLARWDGSTWSSAGAGSPDNVQVLAALDLGDGIALYAASSEVHRLNGSQWQTLGSPGHSVNQMIAFDDGAGPALFARGWNGFSKWDGAAWTSLGSVSGGSVAFLQVHDDGTGPALYLAADSLTFNGQPVQGVARWNGSGWDPVGSGLTGSSRSLLSTPFGNPTGMSRLYASGRFVQADGQTAHGLAWWDGATWTVIPAPVELTHGINGMRVWADDEGLAMFVSGWSQPHSWDDGHARIMRFDGNQWRTVGTFHEYDGATVSDMIPFDDGSGMGEVLWVGGDWQWTAFGTTSATMPSLNRWDGQVWMPMPGPSDGLTLNALAMLPFDDGSPAGVRLVAGGNFVAAGDQIVNRIARWDGDEWSAMGDGFNSSVAALCAYDGGGGAAPILLAAGSFTGSGPVKLRRIAQWNAGLWQSLSDLDFTGPDDTVRTMAAFDGSLYAGGKFSGAGDVVSDNIVRWDGTAWRAVGTGLQSSTYPGVSDLEVFDDGVNGPMLYAAGSFASAGALPVKRIARWDGQTWSAVGPGFTEPWVAVYDLQVFDDGSGPALYAGGSFSSAGGVPAWRIARWNGATWSAVGAYPAVNDSTVPKMTVFNDGYGDALYAMGIYITKTGIARWNGSHWAGLVGTQAGTGHALVGFRTAGGEPALYASTPETFFHQWSATGQKQITFGWMPAVIESNTSDQGLTANVLTGGAVRFQWRRNGVPLPPGPHYTGVDAQTLKIMGVFDTDEGAYDVLVSGDCESVLSPVIYLNVDCRADIAPAPAGDGQVNVSDLLMLIGDWGFDFGSDNAADFNHDHSVSMADLLMMLGVWGPCP